MVKICASILSANFLELGKELERAENAGCDYIHVDVADGEFVNTMLVGLCVAKWLPKATSLRLDAHLAVRDPLKFVDAFADAGMHSLLFHPESTPHHFQVIEAIRRRDMKVGIALLPSTDINSVRPILPDVDIIDQLAVNAGFPNQRYRDIVDSKLAELKRLKAENGYTYEIQVDGGIHEATAARAVGAGAEVLVMGSALFESPDMAETVRFMREAAKG